MNTRKSGFRNIVFGMKPATGLELMFGEQSKEAILRTSAK